MCGIVVARVHKEIHTYQPDTCSAEKQQDDEPVDSGELVKEVLMMMTTILPYYDCTGWTKRMLSSRISF